MFGPTVMAWYLLSWKMSTNMKCLQSLVELSDVHAKVLSFEWWSRSWFDTHDAFHLEHWIFTYGIFLGPLSVMEFVRAGQFIGG